MSDKYDYCNEINLDMIDIKDLPKFFVDNGYLIDSKPINQTESIILAWCLRTNPEFWKDVADTQENASVCKLLNIKLHAGRKKFNKTDIILAGRDFWCSKERLLLPQNKIDTLYKYLVKNNNL